MQSRINNSEIDRELIKISNILSKYLIKISDHDFKCLNVRNTRVFYKFMSVF